MFGTTVSAISARRINLAHKTPELLHKYTVDAALEPALLDSDTVR